MFQMTVPISGAIVRNGEQYLNYFIGQRIKTECFMKIDELA